MPRRVSVPIEIIAEERRELAKHFARVAEVIEGFETPYGMELLSSVHWVAARENPAAKRTVEAATEGVLNWNERKRRLFKPEHIKAAWSRLKDTAWFEGSPENGIRR